VSEQTCQQIGLVADRRGHLHTFFYDMNDADLENEGCRLVYRRLTPGQPPPAPETVLAHCGLVGHLVCAVDQEGRPHVAFHRWNNDQETPTSQRWELLYACRDEAGWRVEQVDAQVRVAGATGLALDDRGQVHLAYLDGPSRELRYACRAGWWQVETVAAIASTGTFSLDLADDEPYLLFLDANEYLVVSHPTASDWDVQVVADLSDGAAATQTLHQLARPHDRPRTVNRTPDTLVVVPTMRPVPVAVATLSR